jgi:hypothetical protein
MRKIIIPAVVTMLAVTAGAAWIGKDNSVTIGKDNSVTRFQTYGPGISVETMKQKIDDLGYDVRRLKTKGGVFKAEIVERKYGGAVKAKFSRRDGELIEARLAD